MKKPKKPQPSTTLTPVETLLDDPQILEAFCAIYRYVVACAKEKVKERETTNFIRRGAN